jgi:hypothetical protein
MRLVFVLLTLVLSSGAAHAAKVVASGRPLMLYQAYSTNPDCTSAGTVVLRVMQGPEHGRVTVRHTGVFPNFPQANPRSVCNRRRVSGVEAVYVSQRGYLGPDLVVLEVLFPAGRGIKVTLPIQVM